MQDTRLLRYSLPHAVVRLFRMVNREHGRSLKGLGVTAEQAHVLAVLWTTGPKTVGELGRALALSSPTLTGALDRMEALKLIRRQPSADDRRSFVIVPTVHILVRERVMAAIERTSHACFVGLDRPERAQLIRLMHKATDALDAQETPHARRARRRSRAAASRT